MSPVLSKFSELLQKFLSTESFRISSLVKAADEFSDQERLEIACSLNKVIDFDLSIPSNQNLVRS